MYLPLTFKYHDLTIQNFDIINEIFSKYHPSETFYQALKWDNGNWVMRYPAGSAVLFSPFYFIADIVTPFTKYPADGFSRPYQLSIIYGCLIYTLIGLYFIKKILVQFFNDKTAALTLIGIALGTNYFFQVAVHGLGQMTHNFLFSLYAIIIYLTIRWHQTYKTKHIFFLGIAIGLATLCRASEIISVFIPLLYGISDKQSFRDKIILLKKHIKQILLLAFVIAAVGMVQFAYYKYASGRFVINPYSAGNPGEGFEFLKPHFLEVLFSFRKGWFIYTPLMIFVIAGFWFLYKKNRALFTPICFYFLINLFVVSSWSCWWLGSCFGNRALIAVYAALCIPLGYFAEYVFKSRIKNFYLSIFVLFISLNLFQSWQMKKGIIDSTNMSRAYYLSTFLQTDLPSDDQRELLLQGKFDNGIELFDKNDSINHRLNFAEFRNYENAKILFSDVVHHSGSRSLVTGKNAVVCDSIVVMHKKLTQKSYTWIKANVWVYPPALIEDENVYFEIHMTHKNWIFKPVKYPLNKMNLKINEWNKLEYFYLTPDDLRSDKDKVCVYFFNKSDQLIYIDDLMLQSYEPIIDQSVF